jgi:uncharacterized protein with PIN domain
VPHTEVDLIVVDGKSVGFGYRLADGDSISVYPVFESFDISPIVRVRPEPLRQTRFVADTHLGRLTRHLRLLGIDTAYSNGASDHELVRISTGEHRILLTRDVGLLKHSALTHGYYVRSTDPTQQMVEVVRRFHLSDRLQPFTRCLRCNDLLEEASPDQVHRLAPPRVLELHDEFRHCPGCDRLYWRGSHHSRLEQIVLLAKTAESA